MLPFPNRSLAEWIKIFQESTGADERYHAMLAINRLGGFADAVPICRQGLRDLDSGVRARAARQLGDRAKLGMSSGEEEIWSAVADELIEKLTDEDPDVRFEAARAAGVIKPQAAQARDVLMEFLADPETQPLMVAAVLGVLAERSDIEEGSLIPQLRNLLGHAQAEVRENASYMVCRMAEGSRALVSELVTALDDDEPVVRENAAIGLGRAGVNRPQVLSALSTARQDDDEGVAAAARAALERLSSLPPSAPSESDG